MAPRRKKIYEGKAKILYEGPEPGTLRLEVHRAATIRVDDERRAAR